MDNTSPHLTNAEANEMAKRARTDKIFVEIRKAAEAGETMITVLSLTDEDRSLLHNLGYAVENLGKYQTTGWYVKWE